ncbi:MAG: twin-arginine translocase TatA/TatE family subunit [Archangium sp.]|nr:twin-arginine translocase TatA/TatE family subunit [Archangium sp.]MDP3157086.1 twin-arginine translocase TatA/TatE family subunit [Archangium sp.]MDP3575803.1 twin-arginine translocase TatA/TatE family subunit [Archangium sp.]
MFNLGSGEIALIAVAALLILGPSRLPELARGIGKFMREFRRQTDEVRGVVEREFYKMDSPIDEPPLQIRPAHDSVSHRDPDLLPVPEDHGGSQLTAGMPPPVEAPVTAPADVQAPVATTPPADPTPKS